VVTTENNEFQGYLQQLLIVTEIKYFLVATIKNKVYFLRLTSDNMVPQKVTLKLKISHFRSEILIFMLIIRCEIDQAKPSSTGFAVARSSNKASSTRFVTLMSLKSQLGLMSAREPARQANEHVHKHKLTLHYDIKP
jgi:hypothetical protein